MYAVPSYQRWVRSQSLLPAYRLHRRFLQHLQWRCSSERWILKAPAHLQALAELCAVYPDVRVIMTHREPPEVLRWGAISRDEVLPLLQGVRD